MDALTAAVAKEAGSLDIAFNATRTEAVQNDLSMLLKDTLIGRLPKLAEVGETVAFAASDHAGAMTASVLNLSCGALPD